MPVCVKKKSLGGFLTLFPRPLTVCGEISPSGGKRWNCAVRIIPRVYISLSKMVRLICPITDYNTSSPSGGEMET